MSNHVHLIVAAKKGSRLSDILRDFKKHTAVEISRDIAKNLKESRREWMMSIFRDAGKNNVRNENYQFWRQDNHPVELETHEMMDQRLDYIHNNPMEAGIVENPEDYMYSSAKDYSGRKGLLEIIFME
jgi:REP-associated tyrosine transposase